MKCEKCGIELNGSTIVCRACKHNNAMQRVSAWRAKRSVALQNESSGANSSTAPPGRQSYPSVEAETNLLQFPVLPDSKQQQKPDAGVASAADSVVYPPWRAKLKEKVREAREKRLTERSSIDRGKAAGDGVDPNQPNPIVAAALNRIQRASAASTARPARSGALATALAKEIEPDRATKPSPAPAPKPGAKAATPKPEPEPQTEIRPQRTPRNVTELKVRQESKYKTTPKVIAPVVKEQTATPQPRYSERDYRKAYAKPTIIRTRKHIKTQIIEIPPFLSDEPADEAPDSPSLWVRTLAGACDFELIATAYLPIFAFYVTLNDSLGSEDSVILFILLAAITFVYQAVFLYFADRTCGMAVLRMRLVRIDDEDQPISRGQKFIRALAATIAFLCPPLNLLVMRLNGRRLSLPDLISRTSPIEE
jgi:uncharacterized RDD family membrane protein YckC